MKPTFERPASPRLEPDRRPMAASGMPLPVPSNACPPAPPIGLATKPVAASVKITAAALVVLGAWSWLGGADGPDDQHANFKVHQQVSAHQVAPGNPAVAVSTAATRAAMGALAPGQKPDLDALMRAVEKDAPALVQGVQVGGLALPPMSPRAQAVLAQQIASGDVKFYEMRFYDHCAEDGDWIAVRLDNGMAWGPFQITHAGTTIRVPISGSRPPNIQIVGHVDGGGGITVAADTGGGNWFSGVMAPGQSELMTYHVQ